MAEFSTFPAGDLEKFVLSSDRRKLLGIQRDDETKQDPDESKLQHTSSLLYGSNEHTVYYLQQIENEITSILIKYNSKSNPIDSLSDEDKSIIKTLLTESQQVINKYNKNKSKSNDVNILKFRHRLRKLFLSPYVAIDDIKEEKEEPTEGAENEDEEKDIEDKPKIARDPEDDMDIYDLLIKKLNVSFNHSKPSDVAVGGDNDDSDEKIGDTLSDFNLQNEIKELFTQCKNQGDITQFSHTSYHHIEQTPKISILCARIILLFLMLSDTGFSEKH